MSAAVCMGTIAGVIICYDMERDNAPCRCDHQDNAEIHGEIIRLQERVLEHAQEIKKLRAP